MSRAQAALAVNSRPRATDKKAQRPQFRDACEQPIGQQADIRPHAGDSRREQQAVDEAVRVIGGDDQGSGWRKVFEIGRGHDRLDAQRLQRAFDE